MRCSSNIVPLPDLSFHQGRRPPVLLCATKTPHLSQQRGLPSSKQFPANRAQQCHHPPSPIRASLTPRFTAIHQLPLFHIPSSAETIPSCQPSNPNQPGITLPVEAHQLRVSDMPGDRAGPPQMPQPSSTLPLQLLAKQTDAQLNLLLQIVRSGQGKQS